MSINTITASGNAGNDLSVRYTANGKAIGDFPLPVKTGYGDNERTSWVTCKIFGERAEKLAPYITKGTKVTVTGQFQIDEWEYEGKKHMRACILVSDLDFAASANRQQPAQQRQPQQPQQQPSAGEPDFDFDSDIPF